MTSRILRLSTSSYLPLRPVRSTLPLSICHRIRRNLTTTPPLLVEGDLGNPQSVSKEQSSVKQSRATEGAHSPDMASVQEPVSDRSAIPGNKDEGTPTEDAVKRDPQEPAGKKRESVEKQGEKPLGVEDQQK